MDSARPENPQMLLSLQETAIKLAVSVDVLLKWNEYHILKPTITQSGRIGYTQEQIDQFVQIRESLQKTQNNSDILLNKNPQNNEGFVEPNLPNTSLPINPNRFTSILRNTSIIVVVFLVGVGVFSQRLKLASLISQYENAYQTASIAGQKTLGTDTSGYQLASNNISPTPVQLEPENDFGKTLHDVSKSTAMNFSYATTSSKDKTSITHKAQVLGTSLTDLQKTANKNNADMPNLPSNITAISANDASTLATGLDVKKDMLAINLGSIDSVNETTSSKSNTLVTIATIGIFGLMLFFTLRSELKYVLGSPQKSSFTPAAEPASEKILGLSQKMDGTVVIYFQEKEYKVCKPELYSDSDQFIERLIELTPFERKEIEYDSVRDEKLRLATPLSRIVTRLGFVGIKRDLFFPRTSKSRVLFRRYITHKDLLVMNLTINDIISDLTKIA